MSRNTTDASGPVESERDFATFLATVVLPDPVPPAIPMMRDFTDRSLVGSGTEDDAKALYEMK